MAFMNVANLKKTKISTVSLNYFLSLITLWITKHTDKMYSGKRLFHIDDVTFLTTFSMTHVDFGD